MAAKASSSKSSSSSSTPAETTRISWIDYPLHCAYFRLRRELGEQKLEDAIQHFHEHQIIFDSYMIPFLEGRKNEAIRYHRPQPCTLFNHFKSIGCNRHGCNYAHTCLICKSAKHGVYDRIEGELVCSQHVKFNREYERLATTYPDLEDVDFFDIWLKGKTVREAKVAKAKAKTSAIANTTPPVVTAEAVAMAEEIVAAPPKPAYVPLSPTAVIAEAPSTPTMKYKMQIDGLNVRADNDAISIGGLKAGARFTIEHDALANKFIELSTFTAGMDTSQTLRHMTIHISY